MNDEKWLDILDMIDNKFEVLDKTRAEVPIGDDLDEEKATEIIEAVIFNGPLGKMKVERITKPEIIDKKTHYSKRAGDKARVEYEFSQTEKVHKMKAYRWDDIAGDYIEIEAGNLSF